MKISVVGLGKLGLPLAETLALRHAVSGFDLAARTSETVRIASSLADACADAELVLDPQFFHAFASRSPDAASVRIELKRGRAHNELTRFRYDVIIRKRGPEPARLHLLPTIWFRNTCRGRQKLSSRGWPKDRMVVPVQ
jgi:hypothetical protein